MKATLDSLNEGMAALSKGVNFLLRAQGLMNSLQGVQGLHLPYSSQQSTTLSGMLQIL